MITVKMGVEKETKNTYVYSEIVEDEESTPSIKTLYVAKAAIGETAPETITVKIE